MFSEANGCSNRRHTWIVIAAVLGAAVSLLLLTFVVAAEPGNGLGTVVWLDGPAEAQVGADITVTISISDVTGLYGGEFFLSFDPADLQVVDADGGAPGVQITPGDCPQPDFVVLNSADNTAGTVGYAATQLGGPPPGTQDCDVAHIRFQTQQAASTVISFTSFLLSDIDAGTIPATSKDLSLDIRYYVYVPLVIRE
ncbi:MAG: hypothetical protein JSW55_18205 [Chloroflexota bacterium]|nr:MAG: hypothetical protein JSW55_18205 [Chloroflexota bacterium]